MTALKFLGKLGFVFLLMAILMAIFLISVEAANFGKIAYGIRLADTDIGGKNQEEAKKILEDKISGFEFSLKNENETLTGIKPKTMGINLLADKSIENAYFYGRNENLLSGLKNQVLALLFKKELDLKYNFDEKKFELFLKNSFSDSENYPKEAGVLFDKKKNTVEITPSKSGMVINRDELKKNISERIFYLSKETISLTMQEKKPNVTEENISKAKELAEAIIKKSPFFITYRGEKKEIDSETIADWIIFSSVEKERNNSLTASVSEEKIKDFLIQLSPALNIPAENAKFAMENGKATAFSLGHSGENIKIDESSKKIAAGIINGENKEIALEFFITEPTITTSTAESFGIKTLIGKGTSNFAGSPQNRAHNIKVGLSKIQGALIKPEEEFSFNGTVGEVDEKSGFLPELVIKSNKTTPEIGGGLCQVSTTLFRAAVQSGLEITERYPHAFPVAYYSPQGFDATVYSPHPDLRFINNTPANILIQGKITGTVITFEFYGTSDGRKVIVTKPEEYDKKEDGAMKTKFTREVWKDGKLVNKEIFYSNYKSPKLYPVENPQITPGPSPSPTPTPMPPISPSTPKPTPNAPTTE